MLTRMRGDDFSSGRRGLGAAMQAERLRAMERLGYDRQEAVNLIQREKSSATESDAEKITNKLEEIRLLLAGGNVSGAIGLLDELPEET